MLKTWPTVLVGHLVVAYSVKTEMKMAYVRHLVADFVIKAKETGMCLVKLRSIKYSFFIWSLILCVLLTLEL